MRLTLTTAIAAAGNGDEKMQGQQAGKNLFCMYADCNAIALGGDYCIKHEYQIRAESAEARVRELEAANAELKSLYANVTMTLYNIDPETFGQLTAREGVIELNRQLEQARKLKLFVWEDVLTDYTSGVMFSLAPDVETARALLKEQCYYLPDYEVNSEPKMRTEPFAVVVWGGS